MGAFDIIPNITIPDPSDEVAAAAFRKKWGWEPHEQVVIKGAYTGVEQEAVENASSGIKGKSAELRTGSAKSKLLEVMIVDWTLTANGRPVKVEPAAIRQLPAHYRKPLLEKCDEISLRMTEEEQEDFLSSANGHMPGNFNQESMSLMPS